jgi:hypothetical protein
MLNSFPGDARDIGLQISTHGLSELAMRRLSYHNWRNPTQSQENSDHFKVGKSAQKSGLAFVNTYIEFKPPPLLR